MRHPSGSTTAPSPLARLVSSAILAAPLALTATQAVAAAAPQAPPQASAARVWNEVLLESIREDLARPTIHARNLFHVSIAMWDAWATYDATADTVLFREDHATTAPNVDLLRSEAICYASYRILRSRFLNSPGAPVMLPQYDALMLAQGYDPANTTTTGNSPAAIGNRIAEVVLAYGDNDNSNEPNDYANRYYLPVNEPLVVDLPGNPTFADPDRWQPLSLDFFVDQSGNIIPFGYPDFLSPEWGIVSRWALDLSDRTIQQRDGFNYWLFKDPGPPPLFDDAQDRYRNGFEMVSIWSSHLDPADGVMVDVSPGALGNSPLAAPSQSGQYYDYYGGGDWGTGYSVNPVTGQPYAPQVVPRGDYARVLAEFWADGPDSETPPGHWYVILNDVSDHPSFVKQLGGTGPVLNDLEWCVKTYLAMGGAMHDAAIAAWAAKGWYDYPRPVSVLRHLGDLGQRTDPAQPSYDPNGINLHPGYVEVVTAATTAQGQRHEHLAGDEGKIALYAWRGPTYVTDPAVDQAGVGWILAENWWPYQRPSFVTPPFAGYVSGHSTYSRAAAVMMDRLTGTPYFPDGLGEYVCPQNQFLVFEEGPSVDVRLQWATYYDASDQCSLSRIWGSIHPPADDLPGRQMGQEIGEEAHALAELFWNGTACDAGNFGPIVDLDGNGTVDRCEALGDTYCAPAVPNSTGIPGAVSILGSPDVATNDFKVSARDLPQGSLGYFLASTSPGSLGPIPGSAGTLCVSGSIGRGVGGGVLSAGTTGTMIGAVDLTAMPQPTGAVAVQAGETWHFQLWHRDLAPLNSNFTDAVAVTFQ